MCGTFPRMLSFMKSSQIGKDTQNNKFAVKNTLSKVSVADICVQEYTARVLFMYRALFTWCMDN